MNHLSYEKEILARMPRRLPGMWVSALGSLVMLGVAAFIYGVSAGDQLRVWQTFLVNFLFWSGIAQAGIIFVAMVHVSHGRWGLPVRRIAESTAAFLPLSFIMFLVLFFGRATIFPWVRNPIPEKAAWLNINFLFWREGIGLVFLYLLSLLLLYYSLRVDVGLAMESRLAAPKKLWQRLAGNWRGFDEERRRSGRALSLLSPIILIVYAYVYSFLAIDFVMSLAPRWNSTLFGGYFFMSNLYFGLAAIICVVVLARKYLGLDNYITPSQFHDLGKLLFGFALFWAYLSFTQYIVIWYANIPEETEFLIIRVRQNPWALLTRVVALVAFLAPFVVLFSRQLKRRAFSLFAISAVIVIGMWFERFMLVVPSLWHHDRLPLGLIELLITLGFAVLFALSTIFFLRHFPAIPLTDLTPLDEMPEHAEVVA